MVVPFSKLKLEIRFHRGFFKKVFSSELSFSMKREKISVLKKVSIIIWKMSIKKT